MECTRLLFIGVVTIRSLIAPTTAHGARAAVDFSGGDYAYGNVLIGNSEERTFTIVNSEDGAATSLVLDSITAPFSYKGGTYPGTGGTCGSDLAGNQSCTIIVTFTPTSRATFNQTLSLTYYNGKHTRSSSIDISGRGRLPASLSISDGPAYSYGTRFVGTVRNRTFTITHSGDASASALSATALSEPFSYRGGAFPGTGGTCGTSLSSGNHCEIVVSFAPTEGIAYSGQLSIGFNDGVGTRTVARNISGTGITRALLILAESPALDYGARTITTINSHVFTVTNAGQTSATSLSASSLPQPFSYKGGTYPGTGGTCGSTLVGNAQCTVVADFTPSTSNSFTATLSINYQDGVSGVSLSINLLGSGRSAALLTISDAPASSFGTAFIGNAIERIFTLTNAGQSSATSLSATPVPLPFSYKGGSYPGAGGTCGNVLAGNAQCTVVVNFSPIATGSFAGSLGFTYHDGKSNASLSLAVSGTGRSAALLTISNAPTVDFGSVFLGASGEQILSMTNSGQTTATGIEAIPIAAPFSFKGGSYPGVGGTCAASLAGETSCSVVVVFAPAETGLQTDQVSVAYHDGVSNRTALRSLSGVGTTRASLVIMEAPGLGFGTITVGTVSTRQLTLVNTGHSVATSLSPTSVPVSFSYRGGAYPGVGGSCGANLAGNSECTVVVEFAPFVPGLFSGALGFEYHDAVSSVSRSVELSGLALSTAFLSLSAAPVADFGTAFVGAPVDRVLTLTNTGDSSSTSLSVAPLAPPFAFKGGSFPGEGGTCGGTLVAGGVCNIVVSFVPSASGSYSADLTLRYDDGAGEQLTARSLAGQSLTRAGLTLSDSPLFTFGTLAVGTSVDHAFTLTNSGQVPATAVTSTSVPVPFSYKGGAYPGVGGTCGASLAGGASCTLVASMSPNEAGNFLANLTLSFHDGLAGASVVVQLGGTAVRSATLFFAASPRYDFGGVEIGQVSQQTLVITNTGQMTATTISAGTPPSPFSYVGGAYPGGGTCGVNLAGGASCSIVIAFAPQDAGAFSALVSLAFHDGTEVRATVLEVVGQGIQSPQAGDLDTAFAGTGKTTLAVGSNGTFGQAVTLQADGRMLVAGYIASGTQFRILLSRLHSNGQPDTSFGNNGAVTTAIGPSDDRAFAVAVKPDGKILVAGYSYTGVHKNVALVQYLANGNLDTTFGAGRGWVSSDVDLRDDVGYAVSTQADGKILVAGYSFIAPDRDFLLLRYLSTGALDTRFNGSGALTMDFGPGDDEARALKVLPDGKYLLAGYAMTSTGKKAFALTRFTSNGGYDATFNGTATVVTTIGTDHSQVHALALQNDGKVVVAGELGSGAQSSLVMARYTVTGTLDTAFGSSGVVTSALSPDGSLATGVAIQSDGKIVAGGYAFSSQTAHFALARYHSAGTLDSSFGNGGIVTTPIEGTSDDRARSLYIQPSDGKIILAGASSTGQTTNMAVARYLP